MNKKELSETDYLLSTSANRARLMENIAQDKAFKSPNFMVKYIIALILPWLSFFLRRKILQGIISLMIPFIAMILFRKYTLGLTFIVVLIPNVWAVYSVFIEEKKTLASKDDASSLS